MTRKKPQGRELVKSGYEKLAFGPVDDAVRLLFCEDADWRAPEKLDLYNVAEIRRPRGGGVEIKFFDRIKALQCLEQMEGGGGESPLYRALEEGARALKEQEGGI